MFQGLAIAAALFLAQGVAAQSLLDEASPSANPATDEALPVSGILVLNQERLIAQTAYGARIQAELEAVSSELAAQNRGIEADLTEEELSLAERRGTMEASEFRDLADAFDARVETIRDTQERKARDLTNQAEVARTRFFERAAPILLDIVRARGAAVLMDSRSVLLSAETVDITEDAIDAIDDRLGDGGPDPLIEVDLDVTPPEGD